MTCSRPTSTAAPAYASPRPGLGHEARTSARQPARTAARPAPSAAVAATVVVAAILAAVIATVLPRPSWSALSSWTGHHLLGDTGSSYGESDGVVPDGATVFDDHVAAVSGLQPALLDALRRAATDASRHGVTFVVNSGWRSRGYQDELLREAVSTYGSPQRAARWVATADTSSHVSGRAVDLGRAGAAWLSRHGAAYGLCQIYRNEPWHFELRPRAADRGCPREYADPTDDPRMQQ